MNYFIQTERLGLRNWEESDIIPFAKMCADKIVMEHFPAVLSLKETTDLITRFKKHLQDYGYTYYAVETLNTHEFIGFTGIAMQTWESDFTPAVDIGWRLKQSAWGKGYATEAAKACLTYASEILKLEEIISVCTFHNIPSENVMQKIGMQFVKEFEHPKLIEYPKLNPCKLYIFRPKK
ncbi:GNAT family acetyltransferase [Patiriisocius marinistellae]|uniref:GNAT family acetyltransferase n=1 Tax=Patiriisocius marinistellae TaxID=2494560 RepID=A0A5J4G156_9FLAO|nr:GNAT family N-acetyltransferase [Patiriisocius marinistellae]GEQ86095.1 GNAT family acetyltransferase [Patiriisocius marinistellae]